MIDRLVELFPRAAKKSCERLGLDPRAIIRRSENNIDRLGAGRYKALTLLGTDTPRNYYGVDAEFSVSDGATNDEILKDMAEAIHDAVKKKLDKLAAVRRLNRNSTTL